MIVDASVILSAYFPDEAQPAAQALVKAHISRQLTIEAPTLLQYELCNAIWLAERRGRISSEQAGGIMQSIEGLDLQIQAVSWQEILPLARRFQ